MKEQRRHVHQEYFDIAFKPERIIWQAIQEAPISTNLPFGLPRRLQISYNRRNLDDRFANFRPIKTVRIILGQSKATLPELEGQSIEIVAHNGEQFIEATWEHSHRFIGEMVPNGLDSKVKKVIGFLFPVR